MTRKKQNSVAALVGLWLFLIAVQSSAQLDSTGRMIALHVDKHVVSVGSFVNVEWEAPWADQCLASGVWIGVKESSGRAKAGPMGEQREIVLTCTKGSAKAQARIELEVIHPTAFRNLKEYVSVEVFYATDREKIRRGNGIWYDNGDWSNTLSYGVAEVSIPNDHRPGELESPVWWKLEFREDPNKHVMLQSHNEYRPDEFFSEVESRSGRAGRQDAFIFVHGFNVELEIALKRTAQLVFDLRLDSVPITYSWPSNSGGVATYTTAENNALKSVDHFKQFLIDLQQNSSISGVNVLAHSMGNRIVVDALHELGEGNEAPIVSHVLLAAPDIDADLFKNEIVPALSASASTTLYSSSGDKALAVSERLHGERRAGSLAIVIKGMDTVDSSDIDLGVLGHSYYADKLLQDIFYILHHDLPAEQRNLLRKQGDGGVYWGLPR